MARPVQYKKPRRINIISVLLVVSALVAANIGWEYLPLYLTKNDAYRVLEGTGSTFAGRRGMYVEDAKARNQLHGTMRRELMQIGIDDPEMESWIEVDGREVSFGVAYSKFIDWPFGILPRTEEVYQVEHTFILKR